MDVEHELRRIERLEERERFAEALTIARRACEEEPEEPALWEARGEMALRAGETDEAASSLARLTDLDPDDAGAWFALGEARQWQGRHDEADVCFRRAAGLDPDHHVVPHRVSAADFERLCGAVLRGLPRWVAEHLEATGTAIVPMPLPSAALVVADHLDPHALGYCRETEFGTAVEVYQLNIENWCGDESRLRDEVRITVLHEVGHAFGMDEAALHEDGYG